MASTTDPKYLIAMVCISELDRFFKQAATHTPTIDLVNGEINISRYNPTIMVADQLTYSNNSYIIDLIKPQSQIHIYAREIKYLDAVYDIDYEYDIYFDKDLLFNTINNRLSEILTSIVKSIILLRINQ